ncbi:type III pantothenate kinase [Marinospirillum celere]|uniref:Type III pantothenate kinase n=1 Tax=Marinospirillum celere TaxID=1122252 RepID=A0A1I1JEP9_9GAMM|nr:type III pantothenate kinase [Marinospirillum celere]SFC47027.1 type III pantothenate kinase [Marinospirillum celere]
MILDLDIGNTLTKWRLKCITSSRILDRGSIWTRDRWEDSDEIPDFRDLKLMRVSNVGGKEVLQEVERLARRYRVPLHVARSSERFSGVRNAYRQPSTLGVDRWLGILAGFHAVGGCCVVDCGSAITIDFVLDGGQHLGGFIAPGIRLMKESLKLGTRNVPIDPDEDHQGMTTPGRTTHQAVGHGIYLAAIGQINTAYTQIQMEQKHKLPIILTGGDALLISGGLDVIPYCWPDMVYAGLELMFPVTSSEKSGQLSGMPERSFEKRLAE